MSEDVYGLFFDALRHCCIRVAVQDGGTHFVQHGYRDSRKEKSKKRGAKKSAVDVYVLPTEDFDKNYKQESTGKPLQEIAQRMLNLTSIGTHVTDRARAHLMAISATTHNATPQENTMSEHTVVAAGSRTKPTIPSQEGTPAASAKIIAGPKGTTQAMVDAANKNQKLAPKAGTSAKGTAAKKAEPAKKAAPAKAKAAPAKKDVKKAAPAKAKAAPAKKDVKKAAPAKAKAAPAKKAAVADTGSDDRKYKVLIKENPCRPGFCYDQVEALMTSKTVQEAKNKLAKKGHDRRIEISWAVNKEFITQPE